MNWWAELSAINVINLSVLLQGCSKFIVCTKFVLACTHRHRQVQMLSFDYSSKQPCTHKHTEAGQLWSHTHEHTRQANDDDRPVCRELSSPQCWFLYFVPHKWVFHLLPFSLTDIGSVLYSLGFDTAAALITFLVHCQANPVNPQIWVTLRIALRQQKKQAQTASVSFLPHFMVILAKEIIWK